MGIVANLKSMKIEALWFRVYCLALVVIVPVLVGFFPHWVFQRYWEIVNSNIVISLTARFVVGMIFVMIFIFAGYAIQQVIKKPMTSGGGEWTRDADGR